MTTKQITLLVAQAIREGRYLNIHYRNQLGENTYFWISIHDVNAAGELRVNMFNITKDEALYDRKIFLSRIEWAEILKFSQYNVPAELIRKLDLDVNLEMYDARRYAYDLLNYYLECYKANQDPFLHKQHLIPGVDLETLAGVRPYKLSDDQIKQIIRDIYHKDYKRLYEYELAVSELSIDLPSRGKFIIAYRTLRFDPVEKLLHLSQKTNFNPNFYISGIRHSLAYYTDISQADFELLYRNSKEEAIGFLRSNFRTNEIINTRPEVVALEFRQVNIAPIYDHISGELQGTNPSPPLRAFFGNLSLMDRKNRKEPNIVLYDRNVNIDQLRTVYNALKFPVTYVQGPPGTGKTQTLLNIVLNCLVNETTLLISSNNNVPIDSIHEKLVLGKYRDKEIVLPVIRLGNNEYLKKALKTIKERAAFETKDVPKQDLLLNLKEKSKAKNKILLDRLKQYEDRTEAVQNLEFVNGLLAKGSNHLLEKEKHLLEQRISTLPEVSNDDFDNIYEVIKENHQLLQFFYYESIRFVKRLKTKEYESLRNILNDEDEEAQLKRFKSWISDDENLSLFTRAFPVVLSTNLSCRWMGKTTKFDLLAIDEAGQCDIATSLIPISKCKSLVLIGDTNQLNPIVVFEQSKNEEFMRQFGVDKNYDYYENSILSTYKRIDTISGDILLSYHYRCGRDIIKYSNMRFYEDKLKLSKIKIPGEVRLLAVTNGNQKLKNSAIEEAQEIIRYLSENRISDAFIITPFRNQEEVLRHYLDAARANGEIDSSIDCGTIHKIQGKENKTIIISTSLSKRTSPKTYDWVKNNGQLINVGVTRARERLVVVTDKDAIDILSRKDDDLYALIDYVQKNGATEISKSTVNRLTIGFSNDSAFEDEFYKTMCHYCTVQGSRYERNVKVTDLFPEEINNPEVKGKEFDGVIYEGRIPKVVFEVNGAEHYRKGKSIRSDKLKMELLKRKDIKRIFIPNHYVKHYQFVRELMNRVKGVAYQEALF